MTNGEKIDQHQLESDKMRLNQLKKEITPHKKAEAQAKKEKKDFDATEVNKLIAEKERLEVKIGQNEGVVQKMQDILAEQIGGMGNIVMKDVPVSNDEANNAVVVVKGDQKAKETAPLHHSEVMWR